MPVRALSRDPTIPSPTRLGSRGASMWASGSSGGLPYPDGVGADALRVHVVTWNHNSRGARVDPGGLAELCPGGFDIYAFGSQEASAPHTPWEARLLETLGAGFFLVRSMALSQIHVVVFAAEALRARISDVRASVVSTGLFAGAIGNKGGVGVAFRVDARTSFCFVNAHFQAHHHNVHRRNEDFHRIQHELFSLVRVGDPDLGPLSRHHDLVRARDPVLAAAIESVGGGRETRGAGSAAAQPAPPSSGAATSTTSASSSSFSSSSSSSLPAPPTRSTARQGQRSSSGSSKRRAIIPLHLRFDRLFFFGDLNYRLDGNRAIVFKLIDDQLSDLLNPFFFFLFFSKLFISPPPRICRCRTDRIDAKYPNLPHIKTKKKTKTKKKQTITKTTTNQHSPQPPRCAARCRPAAARDGRAARIPRMDRGRGAQFCADVQV
jgi:hypothetical protein